jgi:hypothetical protein
MQDMVIENSDLVNTLGSFLKDDFDSKDESDDVSVMSGMFYGPIGEA